MSSSASLSKNMRGPLLPFTPCEGIGETSGDDRLEREGDKFETTRNGRSEWKDGLSRRGNAFGMCFFTG